jgi:hypothetical protein
MLEWDMAARYVVQRLHAGKGRRGYISRAFHDSSAACAVLADTTVGCCDCFAVIIGRRKLGSDSCSDGPVRGGAVSPSQCQKPPPQRAFLESMRTVSDVMTELIARSLR